MTEGALVKVLKPCPFCGDALVVMVERPHGDKKLWLVECWGCGASGPRLDTEDEAGEAWNLRTPT